MMTASPQLIELLRPIQRTQVILWAAFTGVVMPYLLVLYFVTQQPGEPAASPLVSALPVVALAIAIASLAFHRFIRSDASLRKLAQTSAVAAHLNSTGGGSRAGTGVGNVLTVDSLPKEERAIFVMVRTLFTKQIVELALNESVSLVGFVHAFLMRDPVIALPYFALATVLNVRCFPRITPLVERVRGMAYLAPR